MKESIIICDNPSPRGHHASAVYYNTMSQSSFQFILMFTTCSLAHPQRTLTKRTVSTYTNLDVKVETEGTMHLTPPRFNRQTTIALENN